MVDIYISLVNGFLNQLITGGHHLVPFPKGCIMYGILTYKWEPFLGEMFARGSNVINPAQFEVSSFVYTTILVESFIFWELATKWLIKWFFGIRDHVISFSSTTLHE
jgi:hypothetical protein